MIIAVLAAAVIVAWVTVVLLTVGHGFDQLDEGYYLLLYRWWSSSPPNLTGVQYFYGPIFDLLGHNIAGLRVFRLLTVVGAHAAFGWAFMSWLRTRRPAAPATRWWEVAGTLVVVACGGMIYSWLPLSPGYNDVSVLGGLLAAAIVLRVCADVERGRSTPAWVIALLGPLAVVLLLAKWSSAVLTLALVAATAIVTVRRRGWREVGRLVGWSALGVLLTAVLTQLFVAPLTSVVPGMVAINRSIAATSHSPSELLGSYLSTSVAAVAGAVRGHKVLLVAAVFATLARGRLWRSAALVMVAVGVVFSVRRLVLDNDLAGGTPNLNRFPVAVIALLLVPALIGVTTLVRNRLTRPDPARGGSSAASTSRGTWAVIGLLALLPITQAIGTASNELQWMAVLAQAAWAAIAITVVTGTRAASADGRWVAGAATAGVVALTACVAINGLWVHPYRTEGRSRTTDVVAGVPALRSVRLDPQTARAYADLHERLLPWIEPPGRDIMAFDDMSGMVFLLDGRSVGEAWYGSIDPERTAVTTRAACRDRSRGDGRAPVLLFNRPVRELEIETLRACGYDFASDYRLLAPPEQIDGIRLAVYVPVRG
jgi:hypothetical protein